MRGLNNYGTTKEGIIGEGERKAKGEGEQQRKGGRQ